MEKFDPYGAFHEANNPHDACFLANKPPRQGNMILCGARYEVDKPLNKWIVDLYSTFHGYATDKTPKAIDFTS